MNETTCELKHGYILSDMSPVSNTDGNTDYSSKLVDPPPIFCFIAQFRTIQVKIQLWSSPY